MILSRKENEVIHVGNIVVRVLSIDGNRCRIAIEAPKEIKILRGELVPDAEEKAA